MLPLTIIAALIFLVFFWGYVIIRKYSITKDTQDFGLINFIASLTAILGLLITLFIFSFDQYEKNQEKLNRYSALQFELNVNRQNVDIILKTIKNGGIPETRYEIKILERILQTGEVQGDNVIQFWNSYTLMKTSNNLLDKALTIQFYEHIADPRDQLSRSGRRQKISELQKWVEESSNKTILILDSLINIEQ